MDERVRIRAGAGSLHTAAGPGRHVGGGGLYIDGDRRADLLPVEKEVCRHVGGGGEASESLRGGEPLAEAA